MSTPTLNTNYGIPSQESSQKYPALQASDYKPAKLSSQISLAISPESGALLDPNAILQMGITTEVCEFGDSEQEMLIIPPEVKWVILGMPRLFVFDKSDNRYHPMSKGIKLAGTSKVTATRLIMAAAIDGQIVKGFDGTPQLWTLNLKSTKTALVFGDKRDPEFKSIRDLNEGLLKHYKQKKMWLTHLCSVGLEAKPKKFTSGYSSKDSSMGVMFRLIEGTAVPLPEKEQQAMFLLSQSEEVRDFLKDPYNLERKEQQQEQEDPYPTEFPDVDISRVPF